MGNINVWGKSAEGERAGHIPVGDVAEIGFSDNQGEGDKYLGLVVFALTAKVCGFDDTVEIIPPEGTRVTKTPIGDKDLKNRVHTCVTLPENTATIVRPAHQSQQFLGKYSEVVVVNSAK